MKRNITRPPRIALCRVCKGSGQVPEPTGDGRGPQRYPAMVTCQQCGGSGRVTVSCEMELDIRPYRPECNKR